MSTNAGSHQSFLMGVGFSFKPQHFEALMQAPDAVDFVEVHAENYLAAGGVYRHHLRALQQGFPVSLHGVGLSLGGMQLDTAHLRRIAALVKETDGACYSEHLAWSQHNGHALPDLLPLHYSVDTLRRLVAHVNQVQDALQQRIAIENPSLYVAMTEQDFNETAFLRELCERTGCQLLLDLNNVEVSAHNLGYSPFAYLTDFPLQHVRQLHLAGHTVQDTPFGPLLIDDHGSAVSALTWALFDTVQASRGCLPTTLEWDNAVPDFQALLPHLSALRHRQGSALRSRPQAKVSARLRQECESDCEQTHKQGCEA